MTPRTFFKKTVVVLLQMEARAVLRKYKPHIVAVTGSVGKTSTKDAIYAVLSHNAHVRGSDKSFNSEVGVPLTILGCPNAWSNPLRWAQNLLDGVFLILLPARYPEWLVLEVGADRPGDIRSLASWLPVDVAVITRLPEVPVHVEFFDSPEAVAEEKASLINALKPTGTAVLYADDERVHALAARARAGGAAVLTFGLSGHADVRGSDASLLRGSGGEPVGMQVTLAVNGTSAPLEIKGVVGVHALLPVLAAAAVGRALGYELSAITKGLEHYQPPRGRMRLLPGIKQTTIIDDTYNSSPAAVEAALEALATIAPRGRKIAALGDMLELGRHSVEEHRKAGAYVAKTADILATVGFRARDIAQGALDAGMADGAIFQYEDAAKAADELAAVASPGDCILVKGSQSMRMERITEELMKEPERAADLLVRQEREWKRR